MAGQLFGRQVRERRRLLDLTQEELARRVGCAGITIRKLEAGTLRPSQQVAERLARALGVPPDERDAFVRAGRQVVLDDRPTRSTQQVVSTPTSALAMARLSGRVIHGYRLAEQLGSGGGSAVYRALQLQLEREVAVKIVLPPYADHPDFVRRFEYEARTVARLEHPHIVPLYDFWREPGVAFLVMRYLRGGTLGGLLQQGPLSLAASLRLVEQVAAALHAAHHAGVVHRDVKPTNILLDEAGNAYVADFGIANDRSAPAPAGLFTGSPPYVAPEQIRAEPTTPQTDVYALGLVLYELLTGRPPFAGPTLGAILQQQLSQPVPPLAESGLNLPGALDVVVQRATAKAPAARYPDTSELVNDLRAAVGVGHVERLTAQPGLTVAAPPTQILDLLDTDTPFKGLRPFGEADAANFFGREALLQQLLARLGERGELARFLAVVGPSGSGKSSAVRAGLIPALRAGALPESEQWYVVDLLPGPRPLDALAAAMCRVAPSGVEPADLLTLLRADSRGLLRSASAVLPRDEGELVLVIDQFEELFTLACDASERELLLEQMVAAVLDERSRVRLIVTLRADFIDRPLQYVDFAELLQRRSELVLPLTPEELERAIIAPARRVGLVLEDGLAASIIADASGQPGTLPLLQHTLGELYAHREGRTLTHTAYRAIGGIAGSLARSAEVTYSGLPSASRAAAQQIFLRLVTPGDGTEDTRRRVSRTDLDAIEEPEVVTQVLERFTRARLLTLDHHPQTRELVAEVAHEALLRAWPRLRGWIDSAREELRVERRLAGAAAEWLASGRDPSFLAAGGRLEAFASLHEGSTIGLTASEREYLDASITDQRRREEIEHERFGRELQQAQALAQEQRARAEEQAATSRWLRVAALSLAVVSLLAVGAALYAGQQQARARAGEQQASLQAATAVAAQRQSEVERDRADAESRTAQARALAAGAIANLAVDPERSLLLALQAVNTTYASNSRATDEAEQALQRAVQASLVRRTLRAHHGIVYGLAVSPDGAVIATGGEDGLLVLWDQASGQERLRLKLHDAVHSLSFSPDGSRLVAMAGPTVNLHDARTGRVIRQVRRADELLVNAHFSPDGSRLAITSSSGAVYLWDAGLQRLQATLDELPDEVHGLAFTSDGSLLVSASLDGSLRTWELSSGRARFTTATATAIRTLAVSPDGHQVATAGDDNVVRLWDGSTGKLLRALDGHADAVYGVAFDRQGARLISVGGDGTARIWDAASGRLLLTLAGHEQAVWAAAFTPDGSQVVTTGADGTVRIWDTPSGHSGRIADVAVSGDGRLITAGQDDGDATARIWEPTGARELAVLDGHAAGLNAVAIAQDGSLAVTGSGDTTVSVWDLAGGRERRIFEQHRAEVLAVALSPDGQLAASGGREPRVLVWATESGRIVRQSTIVGSTAGLTFSPDGRLLAVASQDAIGLRVLGLGPNGVGRELRGHSGGVWDVAFSPTGAQLASAGEDRTIRLWNTTTWQEERTLASPDGAVRAVAFSPDGALLAGATRRGTVVLWDATTGRRLKTFSQPAPIGGLVFQTDGKHLIAATERQPLVFILDVRDLVATARTRLTRGWTTQECDQYLEHMTCP